MEEYASGVGFVTKLGTMHPPDHFPPGSYRRSCCHGSIAVYVFLIVWNGAGSAVPVSGMMSLPHDDGADNNVTLGVAYMSGTMQKFFYVSYLGSYQ